MNKPPSHLSPLQSFFTTLGLLRESRTAMLGAAICLLWVLVALFADLLAPFDPLSNLMPMQKPLTENPQGGMFWLGTDLLGRDILSRIIYGTQTVLIYAPLATFAAYLVGIIMGLAGGYYQGKVDIALSFVANVILSFPVLVLYILIIATIGSSGINIILAVTFASAPGIFRIVRGLTMDLRNREYVAAAQTRGESALWIMLVEILPNARGPLIVDACLRMGYVIITIGVLGFLGMGLPPRRHDQRCTQAVPRVSPHGDLSLYRYLIAGTGVESAL
ncbi:ABC transporter permease [Marinobacterium rhizophilum]|uniref:ABC transporter permease n=1 Tax=Marinobacterium rhizophilum TaxID=420402 RepID=A0ABY5HHU1_9GAMM|nr:ABC transporter permease [Marinobacterium rhizophilum]UTW11860.1 ABC transporter permease [Marinobacterium rhizophilum]